MAANLELKKVKVNIIVIFFLFFRSALGLELSSENQQLYKLIQSKIQGASDTIKSELSRRGNKTLEIQSYASLETNLEKARTILSDAAHYSEWALTGINVNSRGDEYFMKIVDLIWNKSAPASVGIQYNFTFPLFKHAGTRNFEVTTAGDKTFFEVLAKNSNQNDPIISSCEGRVKLFPSPYKDRLWIYISGKAILKSWLLYEALPEKVMSRELGERVHTVLLNYQKKELASPNPGK